MVKINNKVKVVNGYGFASDYEYDGEVNGMYFLASVIDGKIISLVVDVWVVSVGKYAHQYIIRGQGAKNKAVKTAVAEIMDYGWLKQS
jgi:hypothetical protein